MHNTGENLQNLIDLCALKSLVCVGLFLAYIFLTAMTLMNLLVGVLCEIVMNETSDTCDFDHSPFLETNDFNSSLEMYGGRSEGDPLEMDATVPINIPVSPRFGGLPHVEQSRPPYIPANQNKLEFESVHMNHVQPDVCTLRSSTASTTNAVSTDPPSESQVVQFESQLVRFV